MGESLVREGGEGSVQIGRRDKKTRVFIVEKRRKGEEGGIGSYHKYERGEGRNKGVKMKEAEKITSSPESLPRRRPPRQVSSTPSWPRP